MQFWRQKDVGVNAPHTVYSWKGSLSHSRVEEECQLIEEK